MEFSLVFLESFTEKVGLKKSFMECFMEKVGLEEGIKSCWGRIGEGEGHWRIAIIWRS